MRKRKRYGRVAASIVHSDSPQDSVDLPLQSPFDFNCMDFVCSCKGIVCVRDVKSDAIYLFNPLTRMSKRLPLFDLPLPPPQYTLQRRKVNLAFGFDCFSHDFKVLRITYEDVFSNEMNLLAVHLYSSNANLWRKIESNLTLTKFKWSSCRWSAVFER